MDLSIIIVSWNTRDILKKCLNSIYTQTKNINFEVFVVDNSSKDGTAEMVLKYFPQVIFIANNYNAGFAKANNQALNLAKGDYIFFLNPDTIILHNAIEKLLGFLNNKKVLAGCRLLNKDKTYQLSVRKDPTFLSSLFILLKLHNFFPKIKFLKEYFCFDFDYEKEQFVEQIMGACMMMPRVFLDKVGSLDEQYPLLFEDVDYCKRVRDAGFKVIYTPCAEIIHLKGQSFAKEFSVRTQKNFNKGMIRYFYKQKKWISLTMVLLLYYPSLFLSYLTSFLPQKFKRKEL